MAEPNQNQVRKSLGNTTFRPDTPRPTKVNERKFSFDVNDEELVFHIKEPAMPEKKRAKLDDEVEVVEIPEPEKVLFGRRPRRPLLSLGPILENRRRPQDWRAKANKF